MAISDRLSIVSMMGSDKRTHVILNYFNSFVQRVCNKYHPESSKDMNATYFGFGVRVSVFEGAKNRSSCVLRERILDLNISIAGRNIGFLVKTFGDKNIV